MGEGVTGSVGYEQHEIDLIWLINKVAEKWKRVFLIIAVFVAAGATYAFSLPSIYKSEALLVPVKKNNGIPVSGGLGGIASLAGVSFAEDGRENVTLAMEVLMSREFIGEFIDRHRLLPDLMAAVGWNESKGIEYDSNIYNRAQKKWLPALSEPSKQTAYKNFISLLSVEEVKKSGFVTISFEHYSPILAKSIVDNLVKDINVAIKEMDVSLAKRSIGYLEGQIKKNSTAEAREMYYRMIEEQMKIVLMAEVSDEYVFRTLDGAVVPEEKSGPKRVLLVLVVTFLGSFIAIGWVTFLALSRK